VPDIRRQRRGHGGVRPADPLQRQRDLRVIPIGVVTAVAADDLEGVPVAAFPGTLDDADRLAPEARRDAMPGLTSPRDGHDITGLNAAPRITGMAPAPDANILRTASGPGTGHDMQSFGAQLDPHLSRLGHRRGLEQHLRYLPVSPPDPCGDKRWTWAGSLPPAKMSSIMIPSPGSTRLCENRTARLRSSTLRYRR